MGKYAFVYICGKCKAVLPKKAKEQEDVICPACGAKMGEIKLTKGGKKDA